ncbi:serine carboxypeptidase-like 25 [Telopea speciosissima]|uniref:serine carboxypeptidase-like 25 n=1 Tax=Telopea speciosissima TaxID=54955 RepID=UPI001CC7FDFB|nr:serine carboxypeptidase-like 25 [Telopea speciosissima]
MVIAMAVGKREILLVAMAYYLFLLVSAGKGGGGAEADRIIKLPGQPKVSFKHYSGYVTVNKEAGRALFYWLTEAVSLPESKPLVIWFNGGPGCSSIAYGASEEIGPFRIKKKGTGLYLNKFSWNTVANLLFLESPAGVGFSYTNTSSDFYTSGDTRTAKDALEFVIRWLDRFPHYKQREIYLTGESFAGHYVPQLVKEIMTYNSRTKFPINLKGIMVGNAVIDTYYDNLGTVDYWLSHALISDETYKQILNKCDLHKLEDDSNECNATSKYAEKEQGNIDIYNIYGPTCGDSTATSTPHNHRIQRFPHRSFSVFINNKIKQISGYDPCTENYAEIYYNRPDVQKALHANTTQISYNWTSCNEILFKNWTDRAYSILPIYKEMIAAGLRIWVFSGDADGVVPVTATKYSLAQLNLTTKTPWYPWYLNNQVGGWTEIYEGLTFATVRGAGHEVPSTRPKEGFQLIKSFLRGAPLPPK